MRISHADARQIVSEAFRQQFGREASRPVRQLAQAVGWLESGYGCYWRPPGDTSHNWGAIQAHAWTGPTFSYTDTRPNDDGTSTPYRVEFRRYGSPLEGARDLCKVVYTGGMKPGRQALVLPAAERGDIHAFSAGLYDTAYYQGFGRTREERISHHELAVRNACAAACRETGEPMPDGSDAPPVIRVLKTGASGAHVATLQRLLGVLPDGVYGAATRKAVQAFQIAHALNPDGVWGPVCYRVAESIFSGEDLDSLER